MRKLLLHAAAVLALSSCSGGHDTGTPGPPPGGSGEGEPNDTIAQATPIVSGVLVQASIGTYLDLDYYRIDVPSTGATVRVQTFDSTGASCNGIDTILDFYEGAGYPFDYSDNSGIGSCENYVAFWTAGTYWVEVSGVYPDTFAYSILVTVTPPSGASEQEPNGTIASANGPYAIGDVVTGSIDPMGDVDYFAITNGTGSDQSIQIQVWTAGVGVCGLYDDTYLELYDSTGALLQYNDDYNGFCSRILQTFPAHTTYYAAVHELNDNGTIPAYWLEISQ